VTLGSGFINPHGVAVDAAGNVYVADYGNNAIKEIPAGGGTPVTLGSGFLNPYGVAIDGAGNVLEADYGNNLVKEIKPLGGYYIGPFLPAGLSFNNSTGVISGTPIAISPATTYTITAYNKFGAGKSATLKIAVGVLAFAAIPSTPYGTADFNPGATSTHPITYTSSNTAVATIVSGKIHTTGTGTSSITANDGFTSLSQTLTVTPVPLTITANNQTTVYGTNPLLTVIYTGFVNGDTKASLTTPPIITTVPVTSPVGIYNNAITASGAVDANYVISYVPGTLTITPAPLTITANNQSMVYGTTLPSLTVNYSGFVNSDNQNSLTTQPSTNTTATNASPVATYPITVSGALDANYTISYVAGSLGITPAALTITGNNQSMVYGAALPSLTVNYSGFVNGDSQASLTAMPMVGTTATSSSPVTTYPITPCCAADPNYNISYVNGTLTITTAPLTITANNQSRFYGAANPPLTANYSGFVNGDGQASLTTQPTVSTLATSSSPAGPYQITACCAADPNYSISYVNGTLTVLALSTNAVLSTISLSPAATLTSVTGPGYNNYTASVANAVSSIAVVPTSQNSYATITVNGTAVKSGSASGSIPLAVGPNTLTTIVTAQDGVTTKTYIITVTRAPSSNALLSGIKLTPASTLTNTGTVGNTTTYTTSVNNAVASVTVTATTIDPTATIKVNGVAVSPGTASGNVALAVGANTITTVVTAQDGVTTKTYLIIVTRAKSTNAALAKLSISAGMLSPVFATGTVSYTASVSNATTSVTVTPLTSDATATVTVNGTSVTSGSASAGITLVVGANTITTKVTAQDGVTTKTYTITVNRASSSNAMLSAIKLTPASTLTHTGTVGSTVTYTTSVSNAVASVTVTATTVDPTATIKVNGVTVTSGTASGSIALVAGPNTINTVVTAQDGVTTETYSIIVTRAKSTNATLAKLSISAGTLSPVFATGTYSYTASVSNATTSVKVTPTTVDATAAITVNGAAVGSGVASASIALAIGPNTITTLVTAQDGVTTKTYTITVTRALSGNALLSGIKLTPASTLTNTGTVGTTTTYTTSVSNATASVTLTATTIDPTATIKVNGVTVSSGTASGSIALAVGANTINTVVTAQDGVSTRTYLIVVTRASGPVNNPDQVISVEQTPMISIENDGIVVHRALSPNGDGINDFLVIDGIAAYPENKLTIINRNGAMVFETRGYDNT